MRSPQRPELLRRPRRRGRLLTRLLTVLSFIVSYSFQFPLFIERETRESQVSGVRGQSQCSCSMCASEASADPDGASIHASAGHIHIHKAHSQDTRSLHYRINQTTTYYCTCIRHAINKGLHTHLGHIPEHTSQRSTSMEESRARACACLARAHERTAPSMRR